MKDLLIKMAETLESGSDIVMVTIIASSGSTPRGTGARMIVGPEGRIYGTIGGGAVEYRSEHMAKTVLENGESSMHSFSLTRNDVENLGMICGGDVTVHFQYIKAAGAVSEFVRSCIDLFDSNSDVWMLTDLSVDGSFGFYTKDRGFIGFDNIPDAEQYMTRHPSKHTFDGRDVYIELISSAGIVYVFGGGHVAQELVPVLSHVGFRCVVAEDRPEFLTEELFPSAYDRILVDFDDIFKSISIKDEDYVVIMTRGHAYDFGVEKQVLSSSPRYIGIIGSAKKTAGVNQRLIEAGVPSSALEKVTTPIGIKIKAETPAEIAISIAAQMICVRAQNS